MSELHFRPDALLDLAQVQVIPEGTPVDWNGARVLMRSGRLAQPPTPADPLEGLLLIGFWSLATIIVALVAFTLWQIATERRTLRHRKAIDA